MAGIFNNTTGYLDVDGIYVDEIVVKGKHAVDSDWVLSLIAPAIAGEVHLDSDAVKEIANAVRLNDLIDSDQIATIAAGLDTAISTSVATNAANIAALTTTVAGNTTNITTNANDITLLDARVTQNEADITTLSLTPGNITALDLRVASLENNDTAQDASITGNATDIADIKSYTGQGVTITTTAQTHAGAINELDAEVGNLAVLTTTATGDLVSAINELDAEVGDLTTLTNAATTLVGVVNDYEARIALLEASVNDLIARVGGGATPIALNDLADVTAGTPATGQVLKYNGTDWTAGNDNV